MELRGHDNEFYKFAVIRQSELSNKKDVFDLVRFENYTDGNHHIS